MSLIVNRRDLDFLMYEVFDLDSLLNTARYEDYDREAVGAVLDAAQKIAEEEFLPSAAKLDANEPAFDGKSVAIIPEVKLALDAYAKAGFFMASFDHKDGGLQMPGLVSLFANGMFSCANIGISNYSFLTVAAANLLSVFGSKEQKSTFLPPMLEGRWFGTMCLSEPQAGSSLSDISTKAKPTEDGHYLINGSKMWISGGAHALGENIIHLVLAKIPDGPPGVKGVSLFVVPERRINNDGTLGEENNIALAGLNHKMGHRGTTNTLLNFGEMGHCHGYLIGEPNRGLSYMFHMMNEARIAVGHGAVMSALAGFLYSLDYARNRPQGRLPHNKDPNSPQVMIVEHADIRRLLMAQKTSVEGAMSLIAYCAVLIDQQKVSENSEDKKRIALLLDILTPVAKSWPSEFCLEANKHAIQILGGYGYTRDYPVERFYRDNRLNHIHEGTHAMHGIDILGRKVRMNDGAALKAMIVEIEATIIEAESLPDLRRYAGELLKSLSGLNEATQSVLNCEDLNLGLANATPYLDAFGHVVIAWMWLRQAIAAVRGMEKVGSADAGFYNGKLAACRYFYRYELPKVHAQFRLVGALDDTCLLSSAENFTGI